MSKTEKLEKFRSKLAQFLAKYIVAYSGFTVLLLIIGAAISFKVFPEQGTAAFVMITAASITSALADFAANLISAEQEKQEKKRDKEQSELIDKVNDTDDTA